MINNLIDRIKQEKKLLIILAAAVISCIFVPVSDLTSHIDTNTVGILFSVLAITAGLNENGLFGEIIFRTVNKIKNTRSAAAFLVMLTFFTAPFITNMGAAAIFVPVTMTVFSADISLLIYVLAVQAAAANIGCIIFPSASPCTLFLYNRLGFTFSEYVRTVLPIYAAGFVLVAVLCLLVRKIPVEINIPRERTIENPYYVVIYITLMVLNVFAVVGVINMLTVFASVCLVVVIMDPPIFSKVDYTVIVLIAAMYILIGNLSQINDLMSAFRHIAEERFFEGNIILSQIIGSLPSAMLFSLCSRDHELIVSAGLGSLGFVFSSYGGVYVKRIFTESYPAYKKKYIAVYSAVGFFLMIALYCVYKFVFPMLFQ